MNNELISREALRNAIDTIKQTGYGTDNEPLFDYAELPDLIKLIDNAPTVNIPNYGGQVVPDMLKGWKYEERPQGEWIPVSERLPEEHLCDDGYIEPSDYVLVWGDHGNYGVSRYWGNRRSKSESPNTHKDWVDLDWVVQKPIAWMPLPEPYKEGGKLV